MNDLCRLLLDGECFNGDFASDEGNDISNRLRLQDAVDGQRNYRRASETFQVRWLIYGRQVGGRYSNLK